MNYTGTNQGKYAFHFLSGNKLRNGKTAPKDGEWLLEPPPYAICYKGLHASWRISDALQYAPGPTLCLVEVADIVGQQDDKLVCGRRKIIARFDATQLLRDDARASAQSCLKNWRGAVPRIILDWLNTGDEGLRSAAWSAAKSAAWSESAAESAAWYAAWSAAESARSAAWSAASYAAKSAARSESAAESAAWYASWYAAESARSAAWSAACYAAKSAAESAAESAASERLHNAVMEKLIQKGVLK